MDILTSNEPDPQPATPSPPPGDSLPARSPRRGELALSVLISAATIVVLGGTQGGYFPDMWGPSAIALLALLGVWIGVSGRNDAGLVDRLTIVLLLALLVWTGLSISWSTAATQSILDLERLILIVAGVAAVLLVSRRSGALGVTVGTALGATVISAHALATRLLPRVFPTEFEPIAGYRLAGSIGYWNGLGILTVVGLLLAIGLIIDGKRLGLRTAAGIALVILAPTVYFTFSRGSWIALACGLLVLLAISPRRLLSLWTIACVSAAPAIAVVAASNKPALTRTNSTLAEASEQGRSLLWLLVGLAAANAVVAFGVHLAHTRIRLRDRTVRAIGWAAGAATLGVILAGFVRFGSPITLARKAIDSFTGGTPAGANTDDLNDRLLNLDSNGRIDLWSVAVDMVERRPVVGSGAGTYERYWKADDRWAFVARDAHNLYLETLAEVGIVGLALLLLVLLSFSVALVRGRHTATVPAAAGAFAAFAVHAGVDWDWEIPAVTLAGCFAGCVGLLATREGSMTKWSRPTRVGLGVLVVAGILVSAIGFIGNDALVRAQYALDAGNPAAAIRETRVAARYAPWSPYPHTIAGEAYLSQGRVSEAQKAFSRALDNDRGYWRAWLGLAVARTGAKREAALAEARRRYPGSVEIDETVRLLEEREESR